MIARPRVIVPVVLVVAMLAASAVILTSGDGPSGQRIDIRFEATTGLIAGAEVRAGSVKVGRVEQVSLGADDVPVVTVRLEDDYVVHDTATADVRMLSQAGQLNRYVEMTSGTGRPLGDGAVIGLERTDQPVELDDALGTLTPEVRADLQRITASLDRSLQGRGRDLSDAVRHGDRALRETSKLVADLAADGPALKRLLQESNTLVTELAQDPEGLQAVADRTAGTLAVTARRQQELAATVDGLPDGLRGARRALDELNGTTPRLRRLARAAGPAAREIRVQAPTIRQLLEVAPDALAAAQALTETTPPKLQEIRPGLRDSGAVFSRLPRTLKQFAPLLDEMRARAPDAFGWLALLGDSLGNFDVNGHAARFMFIATPAPEQRAPADEVKPGLLDAPFDRVPGSLGGEPWLDFRDSFVGDRPWVAAENAKEDAAKERARAAAKGARP